MPAHFDDEDDWMLVERRRGRREYGWPNRDRRNEDDRPERYYRSEYPSPENRQTYRRRDFFSREGRQIRRNDYPDEDRWRSRRNYYPSRERRQSYATVTRYGRFAGRQNDRREQQRYRTGRTTYPDPRPRPPREDRWMRGRDEGEDRNPNRRRRYFNPSPRQRNRTQTDRIQSDDTDFLQKHLGQEETLVADSLRRHWTKPKQ
ncbi:pre-mRNA-splicing factor cwc25-like [Gambusia affinis]|uniref:pre-mRNA-splicing factor cwc25-like n=1 Tax=Gambusia affinis TaxID=33528 RepID=UPI001CDC170E|nr:pre-mRNA-splicing factor cwc25-like [Gambusia affinis]XP_043966479.1 pre-mRNA-splicing factor cwc25-like [Gambusia affinis]XP_043966480.1 pre-mRNA-splicing factor cwc25-like [Gambusia affinis]